jgi:NAD(P)-dependent dehydrogenase (short-subunit alcohol dehydrogenase family)
MSASSGERVAIVTGAGRGIGEGAARALAEWGAKVVVADINLPAAEETAASIVAQGGAATGIRVDVSDPDDCEHLAARALEWAGRIDVLFHSAGVSEGAIQAVEMPIGEWRRVLAVNLDGTFFICRAVLPTMLARRSGSVVLMASGRAVSGAPLHSAYAASKAGVIALTKSLAWEAGPSNVTVNCISPGPTDTPMLRATLTDDVVAGIVAADPLRRLSSPADVGSMVVFLAGSGSWITGQHHTLRMYTA